MCSAGTPGRIAPPQLPQAWYSFGEHYGYLLIDAPDNATAAAFSVGISAGGALRNADTFPLLTVEETMAMLGKAQGLPYRTPGTGDNPAPR